MTTTTYSSVKVTYKQPVEPDDNLLTIPLGKLHEFYCNLVMAGFSEHEALQITTKVVSNVIRTN
jgi:hypothetical protein